MIACVALVRRRKRFKYGFMPSAYALSPRYSDLPDVLPVFPLGGVLLLPGGLLPLNVFEPRYIAMVEDALKTNRLIGIIQPHPENDQHIGAPPLQRVGCVGRIVSFSETTDGRYIVTLSGLWRYTVTEELPVMRGYRRVRPDWSAFAADLDDPEYLDLDRERLGVLMRDYLAKNDMEIDCKKLDGASDTRLVTALSMICPFDAQDKQALLEAPCCQTRAQRFMAMLEIATHNCDCGSRH